MEVCLALRCSKNIFLFQYCITVNEFIDSIHLGVLISHKGAVGGSTQRTADKIHVLFLELPGVL